MAIGKAMGKDMGKDLDSGWTAISMACLSGICGLCSMDALMAGADAGELRYGCINKCSAYRHLFALFRPETL